MRLLRQMLPLLLVAGLPLFSASKEIVQLQRDVSLLQEAVRLLQRSLDEKMTELKVLVGQSLEESKRASTSVQVLDSGIQNRMREQEKTVAAPVTNLGTKVDQLGTDFSTLKESVIDLNSRMQRLQSGVAEIKQLLQVMAAPPKPPETPAGSPTPGTSAQSLLDAAKSDKSGGQLDLAMEQLQKLLQWFPTSELAPEAQYYIGEIHYNKSDLDNAIQAFDELLEKYPDNPRTPDGLYMKGMALMRTGKKTEAGSMFREVAGKYPNSNVGPKAITQLKAMGLSTATTKKTAKKR